MAIINEQKVTN